MHITHRTYGDGEEDVLLDQELEERLEEARAAYHGLLWREAEINAQWQAYEEGVLALPPTPADSAAFFEGFLLGLALAHLRPPPKARIDGEWDYGIPGLGNLVFKIAHPARASREEARAAEAALRASTVPSSDEPTVAPFPIPGGPDDGE